MAMFIISFGWVNENAIDCFGKRVTHYNPIVAKYFRQDEGVVIHGPDKRNRITTTEDLKGLINKVDMVCLSPVGYGV